MTFDVFGTVVDWRGSIISEGADLSRRWGMDVDWGSLADAWRGKYRPSMDRVRSSESPWLKLDALHRHALDELLPQFKLDGLHERDKVHLNQIWHRLRPWPDSVAGLERLRRRYTIATLSNGNVSLLVEMAKRANLPWDCILSAELVRAYKPDHIVYQSAAEFLGLPTSRVMMVAAHPDDLRAAAAAGMATGYVPRPLEWGEPSSHHGEAGSGFDVTAGDFVQLAEKLGT